MKINLEMIQRLGACWDTQAWREAFGDATEIEVNAENARKFAGVVTWSWLAGNLLTSEGLDKFYSLMSKAEDSYYADRQATRDALPYPLGLSSWEVDEENDPNYTERKRRYKETDDRFRQAYADNFIALYTEEREYADRIMEWVQKDTKELGPNGVRQYRWNEVDLTGSMYDG